MRLFGILLAAATAASMAYALLGLATARTPKKIMLAVSIGVASVCGFALLAAALV